MTNLHQLYGRLHTCHPTARSVALFSLVKILTSPTATGRALSHDGGYNTAIAAGEGQPLTLMQEHPGAAVVAPLRPCFIVLDLDNAAALLPHLEDAAGAYGAALVYLAASGSPDSVHAVYACPSEAGRAGMVEAVERLRGWSGHAGVDLRTPSEVLRMPGAPSLKPGGGPVTPAEHVGDGELLPIDPETALTRALDALEAVGWSTGGASMDERLTRALEALDAREVVEVETPAPAVVALETVGGLHLDPAARAALNTPAPAGMRYPEHHARAAAHHLFRCGGRVWSEVAGVVRSAPALEAWRGPGGARKWAAAAAEWSSYRPDMAGEDARVLEDAAAAAHLLPARLESALFAVLALMRKAGRVEAVAVSERCLVVAGAALSRETGGRLLGELEGAGVLTLARRWEDGPVSEAKQWTLRPVDAWKLTTATFDPISSPPPVPSPVALHPIWLTVGHDARRFWALLSADALTVADAADALGVPLRSAYRWRSALEGAGLIKARRDGRRVLWSAVELEAAPAAVAAVADLEKRRELVAVERVAWRELVADTPEVPDSPAGVEDAAARVSPLRRAWRWSAAAARGVLRGGSRSRRADRPAVEVSGGSAAAGRGRGKRADDAPAGRTAGVGGYRVTVDMPTGGPRARPPGRGAALVAPG